jgi:hypothetical protein
MRPVGKRDGTVFRLGIFYQIKPFAIAPYSNFRCANSMRLQQSSQQTGDRMSSALSTYRKEEIIEDECFLESDDENAYNEDNIIEDSDGDSDRDNETNLKDGDFIEDGPGWSEVQDDDGHEPGYLKS